VTKSDGDGKREKEKEAVVVTEEDGEWRRKS